MKRFAIGCFVLLVAFNVNAQTPQAPPPVQPVKPVAPARYQEESSSSNGRSADNRVGKFFTITGQPLGITSTALVVSGLNMGFSINPNSVIWVDLLGNISEDVESEWRTKVRSVAVSWKQFLGNSFYLKGGLEHRMVTRDYDYFFPGGTFDEQYGYKGTSTGVTFAVGNQWQIAHFTIGCDWFGIVQPLSHTRTDEYVAVAQSNTATELQKDSDDALKDLRINVVNFYLGASF